MFLDMTNSERLRLVLAFLLTFVCTSSAVASASSRPLSIEVREDIVTVSNVSRGGAVVLVNSARTTRRGTTHVEQRARLIRDDDGNGSVSFTPEEGVPLRSVWIAVELSSGAIAHGTRPNVPLNVGTLQTQVFRKDAEGDVSGIEQELRRAFLVLVRPGKGAWMLIGVDGDRADKDGARNMKLRLEFGEARAVEGKDLPPKKLAAGDVIVSVDPAHLDVLLATVTK